VIFELGRDPEADAYPVSVRGERFNWFFEHPELQDANGQPVFETAVLHIPAGREISITVTSVDVIHSFAVPRLAGTRDAIPGREETYWIKADHPGTFAGQCRELCGTGHANMRITVIAQSQEDFEAWGQEMVSGRKTLPGSEDAVTLENAE
jgi:cytochrome c oxidase subunit 2